jgi:3-hydroxyisobutyrate dehydrogenase-like beta-hydroxyacid dehydrogenase
MPESDQAVTMVGTGVMGSALAGALLRAGHQVTVWNRTAARAEPLREAGASVAGSLPEAIAASDVTLMCVSNQAAADELLSDPEVLEGLRGKTLVQMNTGTPEDGRRNAVSAAEHRITYLDGAMMAYPRSIGTMTPCFCSRAPRRRSRRTETCSVRSASWSMSARTPVSPR